MTKEKIFCKNILGNFFFKNNLYIFVENIFDKNIFGEYIFGPPQGIPFGHQGLPFGHQGSTPPYTSFCNEV